MNDGCPDGWAGRIPVCALPATAQQENGNSTCSSRIAHDQDANMMMERDYIGLGLTGASVEEIATGAQCVDEEMECDDVELCLGLACSAKSGPQDVPPSVQTSTAADEKLTPKDGAKLQQFWHQNFRVSLSNDRIQHIVNQARLPEASSLGSPSCGKGYTANATAQIWGPVSGRFMVPVPKVSTTPAKRSYQDAAGERRTTESLSHNVMHSATAVYSWNSDHPYSSSIGSGGNWQSVNVNYDKGHTPGSGASSASQAFAIGSMQLGGVPSQVATGFKTPQPPSNVSMPPQSNSTGLPAPSRSARISSQPELEHDGNQSKLSVVGWPPIRSYRRNTLQATQINNREGAEDLDDKGLPVSKTADALQDSTIGANNKNGFFVKAKLDGVRICRKVDLKAYDSYDGLKVALQEMFQGFVSDVAKLDLVSGKYYVLTHEDKDGDCLLVGDVPWHMFLESSVKSLRIMKAMDAIGIGEKAFTKSKAQDGGKH